MKNILICGTAKSGKSYLAKKICEKERYNHIPLDYFTSSLKHNFPETKIKSNVIIDKESSKQLSLLLSRVIEVIDNCNTNEYFIIDSAHLYPNDIIKYVDKNKWDIVFLGYPNTTKEKKLQEIKKYCGQGWTKEKTDDELLELLDHLIEISKNIEKQCIDNNIRFLDTSVFENINNY